MPQGNTSYSEKSPTLERDTFKSESTIAYLRF